MKAEEMKMQYILVYWLPNQSKLFSEPQYFTTPDKDLFEEAVLTAMAERYEIESIFAKAAQ